jgi:hypothetical protein
MRGEIVIILGFVLISIVLDFTLHLAPAARRLLRKRAAETTISF